MIVEDDEMVRNGIADALQLRSWKSDTAYGFMDALKKIKENKYILFILDMKLPDGSGIALCREIRKRTDAPVLFLSALDSEGYIVEGFEAGGNDYVIKPFRTFELLARVKALLNRAEASLATRTKSAVKSGDFLLDLKRQCVYKKNCLIELTLTEYRILCCLITNAPQLIERTKLLELIWDAYESYVDDNALSVYIARIRRKITENQTETPIETKRGLGYRWILKTEEIYETILEKQ